MQKEKHFKETLKIRFKIHGWGVNSSIGMLRRYRVIPGRSGSLQRGLLPWKHALYTPF